MPLTARQCETLRHGRHGDGGGLYLSVSASGSRSWVYRYTFAGKRREMGIGPYPDVSLKAAREKRLALAAMVADGMDPIEQGRVARLRSKAGGRTVEEMVAATFEKLAPNLRDGGKAGRWRSPLDVHVIPIIGTRDIETIDQQDICATLKPIWHAKPDAARKALQRLNLVMKHAAAHGLDVDLNATLKAKALLGERVHREEHIPAMPWQDVPAFFASLDDNTPVKLALRLLILTASRGRPIRFARVEHFDIKQAIWTIPGDGAGARMKGAQGKVAEFRIPLPPAAIEAVQHAIERSRDGFLFPGIRKGVISDASMSRHMERQGLTYRPHGFRSSFRDWADSAGINETLAEMALAHVVGSKVSRAYRRDDRLEERRAVMDSWAAHVTGNRAGDAKVIRLNRS